jgi:saccharopine dehydrogenase-like NADP-dependent oxidoreductase
MQQALSRGKKSVQYWKLRFLTAYIDVCDDRSYSCLAKTFHEKVVAAQVPAITTAGIYPGVSNCMPSAKVAGVL